MRTMLAGLLGCLVVACGSPGPQAFLDTDKTAIRASIDSFTAYVVTHRDSMAAAMYTENAAFMPPNQPIVQGRAAIRAWIKAQPRISQFTGSAIEINGREDLAYVRGTYQLTYLAGGTDHGKFVEVRQRDNNRRWLMIADIFNSDAPSK
jgi:ketosteroid isomerase-like protein